MKLSKAIEILTKWREEECVDDEEELHKAEQLGIEALKAIKHQRDTFHYYIPKLLPGETPPDTLLHPTKPFIGNRP